VVGGQRKEKEHPNTRKKNKDEREEVDIGLGPNPNYFFAFLSCWLLLCWIGSIGGFVISSTGFAMASKKKHLKLTFFMSRFLLIHIHIHS
jgi:hypothetical protein